MRSASSSTLVFCVAAITDRVAAAPAAGPRPDRAKEPARDTHGRFAWLFEWLFDWRVEWLFAIEAAASAVLARRSADRGDAVLPTSPRPIEVWS